jgi:hypothetical protein
MTEEEEQPEETEQLETEVESVQQLRDAIEQKRPINLGGPMCSGKTTFLEYLKSKGYKTISDWASFPDLVELKPEDQEKRAAWYAQNWPSIRDAIIALFADKETQQQGVAIGIWSGPLKDWVNVFINHFDKSCIDSERDWGDSQKHLDDMQHSMENDSWDIRATREQITEVMQ